MKRSSIFKSLITAAFMVLAFAPVPQLVQVAQADALSNYSENKLVDYLMRGQAFTAPTSVYVGLATTAGSDAACGTEVSGGSYARVAVSSSTANWAGTQGVGTTAASSGTTGTISNNNVITFPAPTANWGTVVEVCVFDAATTGNLLWRVSLTQSKLISSGDAAPSFAAAALTFQIDN